MAMSMKMGLVTVAMVLLIMTCLVACSGDSDETDNHTLSTTKTSQSSPKSSPEPTLESAKEQSRTDIGPSWTLNVTYGDEVTVGTGTVVGEENTGGALEGRTPAGPLTFGRITPDDGYGVMSTYVGEGLLTDDPLDTFGCRAVAEIPRLQALMHFVCTNGFEHHVAVSSSNCAWACAEAFENYLGWETYYHGRVDL